MRTMGRTVEQENRRAAASFRDLDRDVKRTDRSVGGFFHGIAQGLRDLKVLVGPGMLLAKFGIGLGVAAQAVGVLGGGVVGLLPRIADLSGALAPAISGFAGLAASMVTARLAFGGIGQAVSGNAQAMRQLTPQARALVQHMRQLRPLMREFRMSAQGGPQGLISSAGFALSRLRPAAPTVNRILRGTSDTLGGLVRQGAARFTQPGFLRDAEGIAGQGNQVIARMGRGIFNLIDALRHVAVAAKPFTDWLSRTVLGWTRSADAAAKLGRESGRLAGFFERTRTSMTNLGHIAHSLWVTLSNLLRDARPLGDELWRAAEKTTAGWARVTSTIGNRQQLTRDFLSMGRAIRSIFDLLGQVGAAIWRIGARGGLERTVGGLQKLVPSLEHFLGAMAQAGPTLANTLAAAGQVLADLAGTTGPLQLLLDLLSKTFQMLHGIIGALGPFKNLLTAALSTALILRFASKLGLIEFGWKRVAISAEQAAAAQAVAMAAGGTFVPGVGGRGGAAPGGGFITLGPAGRGVRGFIGRTRGRISRAMGVRADAQLAARGLGTAAGGTGLRGLLGTAGEAGGLLAGARVIGGAGLGSLMGVGRVALGAASKVLLPLMAIQGLIGGLTAGRSGGFLHQAAQTGFGAANAALLGIPGHFFHGLDTPEQQAQRKATEVQKDMTTELSRNKGLTHDINYLEEKRREVTDRQTEASKALIAQIDAEIRSRKEVKAQLDEQNRAAGQARGMQLGARFNALFTHLTARGLSPAAARMQVVQAALTQIGGIGGSGMKARAERLAIEQGGERGHGLLGALFRQSQADPASLPAYQALVQGVLAERRQHGLRGIIREGRIFTGDKLELAGIRRQLADPVERQLEREHAAPTRQQRYAMYSLEAMGMSPALARTWVMNFDTTGRLGDPRAVVAGERASARPRRRGAAAADPLRGLAPGLATGGRIAGLGIADTVPVGGLAAPGELIVNKHTERRVDELLGAGGRLAGLVHGEGRPHSSTRYKTGGRAGGAGGTGMVTGDTDYLPELGARLEMMAAGTGHRIYVQSGRRTLAQQQKLYNELHGIRPVALPNANAPHVRGIAADITPGSGTFGRVASSYGLVFDVAGEPWHIELRGARPSGTGAPQAEGGSAPGAGPGTQAGAQRYLLPTDSLAMLTSFAQQEEAYGGITGLGGITTTARAVTVGGGPSGAVPAGGQAPVPYTATPGTARTQGGGSRAANKALAHQMMLRRWPEFEWPALDRLWTGESGFDATIYNREGSGAQGIPQFLPMKGRPTPPGFPDNPPINAAAQIGWGLNYISGRYGRPSLALRHWLSQSPHSYETGGRTPKWGGWHAEGLDRVFDKPTVIGVGDKGAERVKVTPTGKAGGAQVNATFHIYGAEQPGRVREEVEAALRSFARHLDAAPLEGADLG